MPRHAVVTILTFAQLALVSCADQTISDLSTDSEVLDAAPLDAAPLDAAPPVDGSPWDAGLDPCAALEPGACADSTKCIAVVAAPWLTDDRGLCLADILYLECRSPASCPPIDDACDPDGDAYRMVNRCAPLDWHACPAPSDDDRSCVF